MNEQELIKLLREKNEPAFKWLVDTYHQRVYNTVLSLVQNVSEAEDVAQEVFIKIFESIISFRGEAKLSTWIYRISVHKALDKIKRTKTKKRFALFVPWTQSEPEEPFYHPGLMLDKKEKGAVLFQAIRQLPDNQQIAFTLIKVQGMNYEEVSRIMKISVKAIESLLSRAKINLQKTLEKTER